MSYVEQFRKFYHLQIEDGNAFDVNAVNISIWQAANHDIATLSNGKTINLCWEVEELAVFAIFIFEKNQTVVNCDEDLVVLQACCDTRVVGALKQKEMLSCQIEIKSKTNEPFRC